MTHTYQIKGMTCSGCEASVTSLISSIPGVISVKLNRQEEKAEISMDKHIPTPVLQKALAGSKYTLSEAVTQTPPRIDVNDEAEPVTLKSYKPVFMIFGFITGVTLINQFAQSAFDYLEWMRHFMAGFFLVFSFFKLLDISGFAAGYSSYDIVAKKFYAYGYMYPFIELFLGISFLIPGFHTWSNLITLIVMSVSIIGVIQSMLRKSRFQCACLGVIFKLPLSKITLIEDGLMILMSGAALIMS